MTNQFTYLLHDSLYINLTNRCTNSCDFCVRTTADGSLGYDLWLQREPEADEIIAQIGDPKQYKEIVFCGYGESTLRLPELLKIARYVKANGGRVRINTNGQANLYYSRDVTPDLEGLIDHVSISLNAPNAAGYDAVCHSIYGPAGFEGMLDFTRRCKQHVPQVTLTVVDVLPPEDIERCRRIAEDIGVSFRVRHAY